MTETHVFSDKTLEKVHAAVASVATQVTDCIKKLYEWRRGKQSVIESDWEVLHLHMEGLRDRVRAIGNRIVHLDSPFFSRLVSKDDGGDAGGSPVEMNVALVDHANAYDEDRLNRLDAHDISEAMNFDTQLKDTFGFATTDEEVRETLMASFKELQEVMVDGQATTAGTVARVLKAFMKAHPRGFGRYYTGVDPWPRSSTIIQAEIDMRMPDALEWLRFELSESLELEARRPDAAPPLAADATETSEPAGEGVEAMTTLRGLSDKPDPTDGKIVTAVNGAARSEPAQSDWREDLERFWAACNAHISSPDDVEFCKAGAVMWDHIKINGAPKEWLAWAMSLKEVDDDLARAVQAALFSGVATTVGPVDFDGFMHVVRTFVHAHPAFASIVKDGVWELPYGDSTEYLISEFGEGSAEE